MLRFYLKLFAPLFILFVAVALLIRAQPYDDHDIRALLMPDNCQMPCFMGIKPGVTTVDQAVKILGNSNWVQSLDMTYAQTQGLIMWSWSGLQPKWLFGKGIIDTEDMDNNGTREVFTIQFNTTVSLSQIALIYGDKPDYSWFALDSSTPSAPLDHIPHRIYYENYGVEISSNIPCPIDIRTMRTIWDSTTEIWFGFFWDDVEEYDGLGQVFPHYSTDWLTSIPGC